MRKPEREASEPPAVHALPLLVRENQSKHRADSRAPLGAHARGAPVSLVVRAASASWIVHEREGHRSGDCTARRALDHAGAAINAMTDIEPDDRRTGNCQRAGRPGQIQAKDTAVR